MQSTGKCTVNRVIKVLGKEREAKKEKKKKKKPFKKSQAKPLSNRITSEVKISKIEDVGSPLPGVQDTEYSGNTQREHPHANGSGA